MLALQDYIGINPQLKVKSLMQVAECAAGDSGSAGGAGRGRADCGAAGCRVHFWPCAVLRAQHHHAHFHDGTLTGLCRRGHPGICCLLFLVLDFGVAVEAGLSLCWFCGQEEYEQDLETISLPQQPRLGVIKRVAANATA